MGGACGTGTVSEPNELRSGPASLAAWAARTAALDITFASLGVSFTLILTFEPAAPNSSPACVLPSRLWGGDFVTQFHKDPPCLLPSRLFGENSDPPCLLPSRLFGEKNDPPCLLPSRLWLGVFDGELLDQCHICEPNEPTRRMLDIFASATSTSISPRGFSRNALRSGPTPLSTTAAVGAFTPCVAPRRANGDVLAESPNVVRSGPEPEFAMASAQPATHTWSAGG